MWLRFNPWPRNFPGLLKSEAAGSIVWLRSLPGQFSAESFCLGVGGWGGGVAFVLAITVSLSHVSLDSPGGDGQIQARRSCCRAQGTISSHV